MKIQSVFAVCIAIILINISSICFAQKVIAYDFESPIDLKDWFVANKEIKMSQCSDNDCPQLPGSTKCLRIEWNYGSQIKTDFWFSDIKIDTFGNKQMETTWQNFKENTWLSFKVNTNNNDQFIFSL